MTARGSWRPGRSGTRIALLLSAQKHVPKKCHVLRELRFSYENSVFFGNELNRVILDRSAGRARRAAQRRRHTAPVGACVLRRREAARGVERARETQAVQRHRILPGGGDHDRPDSRNEIEKKYGTDPTGRRPARWPRGRNITRGCRRAGRGPAGSAKTAPGTAGRPVRPVDAHGAGQNRARRALA